MKAKNYFAHLNMNAQNRISEKQQEKKKSLWMWLYRPLEMVLASLPGTLVFKNKTLMAILYGLLPEKKKKSKYDVIPELQH